MPIEEVTIGSENRLGLLPVFVSTGSDEENTKSGVIVLQEVTLCVSFSAQLKYVASALCVFVLFEVVGRQSAHQGQS